jgi:putative component of toxin-antitoxin plasmid stabilization module
MSEHFELVPTSWYMAEVGALAREQRVRIDRTLVAFANKGWAAAMADQTIKHLRDGIHELRVLGTGPAFRVLFFVVPGRAPRVVVLTTCASKSVMQKRQRMNAELERARNRRAAWLEQQKQRGRNGG